MGCTGGYAGRLVDRLSVAAMKSATLWGLKWRNKNRIEGLVEHLIRDEHCIPILFATRRQACAYREKRYGYIRTRVGLRVEPHGWRMPKVIRVEAKEVKQ